MFVDILGKNKDIKKAFDKEKWINIRPGKDIKDITFKDIKMRISQYYCMDCKNEWPHSFMVRDIIWKEAGLLKGFICLTCLEKRLKRKLKKDDFKKVPINNLLKIEE